MPPAGTSAKISGSVRSCSNTVASDSGGNVRRQPWDRSEALARRPMDVMRGEATVEARGAALMLAGAAWTSALEKTCGRAAA
jgi:hypothetical protein